MSFHPPSPRGILTPLDLAALAAGGTVHFLGVGGAGMTPLAELLLRAGGVVTGCDRQLGAGTAALEAAGARITAGHSPEHVAGCAALVTTAAVPSSHPEIAAARRLGIPVLKRAEALGAVVNRGLIVGVAGTHGKTTTTTLATLVLAAAGLEPTGIVGARVPAWNGNLHPGAGRIFVVEADEYDRSFLTLSPTVAVVTTIEADHLDIYGTLSAVEEAFADFAARVRGGGALLACTDDAGARRLLDGLRGERDDIELLGYGTGEEAAYRAANVEFEGDVTHFDVLERGVRLGRASLPAPGLHNVQNALAAVAVGRRLGADWDAIAAGIAAYGGVARRFERIGDAGGITFVDDYAHHPTELEATLRAARLAFPARRIVALFQPHLYSRTRDFAREFGEALAVADRCFVTDVYAAREAPIAGVSGALIADAARAAGAEVEYVPERAAVVRETARELMRGDVCITLGAGDLDAAARELHGAFAARAPVAEGAR